MTRRKMRHTLYGYCCTRTVRDRERRHRAWGTCAFISELVRGPLLDHFALHGQESTCVAQSTNVPKNLGRALSGPVPRLPLFIIRDQPNPRAF